jgi:hypothetical protein
LNHTSVFKCDFNECNFETNTALKLKRHSLNHIKEAAVFKCDSCEYTSDVKSNVTRHKKDAHEKQPKCGKRQTTAQSKNRNKDLNTARKRKERDLEREQRAAEQAATNSKRVGGVGNRCTHGPYTCCDCPPKVIAEGVKLCEEKIILYHASTNVAMCVPVSSPEVVAKNI